MHEYIIICRASRGALHFIGTQWKRKKHRRRPPSRTTAFSEHKSSLKAFAQPFRARAPLNESACRTSSVCVVRVFFRCVRVFLCVCVLSISLLRGLLLVRRWYSMIVMMPSCLFHITPKPLATNQLCERQQYALGKSSNLFPNFKLIKRLDDRATTASAWSVTQASNVAASAMWAVWISALKSTLPAEPGLPGGAKPAYG